MKTLNDSKKYLSDFLKIAPLSHALWRTTEALSYQEIDFKHPVLDLGCGWGEFAGVVFNQMEMGTDINRDELAQALKGKSYKKVEWADARNLPFKDESYATVISVSVMEHITDCEKVIKEVHRVLKKDGQFIFSVPTTKLYENLLIPQLCSAFGLKSLGEKYFELHSRTFKHVNLKTSAWWEGHLKKAGFEIVRKEGTITPTLLKLHEIFLITAFPSQFWKLFFGKRLIMSAGLRSAILPIFFSRVVQPDKNSDINLLFVARKKNGKKN